MNPIQEKQLRINEDRFKLDEEDWITNRSLRGFKPTDYKWKVVKGPPKPTEEHTSKQLIEQGLIGVYRCT